MALINTDTPVQVTLSTVDNNRRNSSTSYYLPTGITQAGVQTSLDLIRGPFLALTQNRLLGASAAYAFREDAPIGVIPASAESERKLVLIFDVDNGRGVVVQEIPSPVFTIETDNTDEVDPADPLVAAYADVIVDGAFGPLNGATNQYSLQITGLRRAFVRHNSSRSRR
jgi:hypothetical protein